MATLALEKFRLETCVLTYPTGNYKTGRELKTRLHFDECSQLVREPFRNSIICNYLSFV